LTRHILATGIADRSSLDFIFFCPIDRLVNMDQRLENSSMLDRKSTSGIPAIGIIAPIVLLVMSTVCGVTVVELLYHVYNVLASSKRVEYKVDRRIMFFGDGDKTFENKNDIFTYSANKDIRSLAVYFNDDNFVIEYSYRFHTNNFGLVQDADIARNVNSMLFLGNSFTEGQGAAPWFRHVAGEISNLGYQPINGGLWGTGFGQWSKLETYLESKSIQIQKLVVLFISDDYNRDIWHFHDQVLQCLSVASNCRGDEGVYPLPPMEELSSWVNRIKDARRASFKERLKKLLPASYRVYDFIEARLGRVTLIAQHSDAAIAGLIEKYGTMNVTFIHLPQKDELDRANRLGLSARRSIEKAGGRLYDGFKLCGLTPSDYHINDGHPNERGYAKIAHCTSRIIEQREGSQRG
jgi:hypothetical protein